MEFTVIGHACLYIKAAGLTILVDPWLSGSCYWRSWWHFPPNTDILPEHLSPDIIYISHHHFDHFHYPSLRRLNKRARVFVPRFAVDVMRHELTGIGFTDISEMAHGDVLALGPDVRIASYQYGPDDSAFVVSHAGTTFVDLNDCKIKGSVAQPIVKAFGHPKFIFKSHSFAQAYPNCYDFENGADALLLRKEDFIETFITSIADLKPDYAVPFASMVAFLHPDSWACNEHAVTPSEVAAEANQRLHHTQTVVMAPGDRWDSASGFARQDVDYYSNKEVWLHTLEQRAAPALAANTEQESAQSLSFETFKEYFDRFLTSVPRLSLFMFRKPVAFSCKSPDGPYWIIDPAGRKVHAADCAPQGASIVHVPEGPLADAIAKNVVNFLHISMRIRVTVPRGALKNDVAFWMLLILWELGYFPLRRCFTPRAVGVAWRRRREFLFSARALLRPGGLVGKVFSTRRTQLPRPL